MVSSDQPGGSHVSKDAYIESLLQQLHEKDSIISVLKSSRRAGGLGLSLGGSNVTVTWSDFLQAAKRMHAKNAHLVSKPTWYSPPAQRIRWGGDQSLQHVDWGDLFFDLFYVSAVYNLGVLGLSGFATGEHLRAAIYFLGSLGPLWSCWSFHVSRLHYLLC